MNERIRKLALETDAWCDQNWAGHEFYNIRWEEKFAELIVRECAGFIDSHEQIDIYGEAMDIVLGQDLLEHFGVE